MNRFLSDHRFVGLTPFEKKSGDVCIIGLKSRKRPRRLVFLNFQPMGKPSENSPNRSEKAKNDAGPAS